MDLKKIDWRTLKHAGVFAHNVFTRACSWPENYWFEHFLSVVQGFDGTPKCEYEYFRKLEWRTPKMLEFQLTMSARGLVHGRETSGLNTF